MNATATATVSRCETSATVVMEALVSGGYTERVIEKAHAWKCDGCRRVWEKKWHAETCASRGHVDSFEQGPYGVSYVENGVLKGNVHYYTRRAIRRDPA